MDVSLSSERIITHIVTSRREAQGRLASEYPDEVEFFKRRFIWAYQNDGFYTRTAYEAFRIEDGPTFPKWRPFKTRGGWQKLYTDLVDALADKHLVFYRFSSNWPCEDRLHPADYETAFWLGMMAGDNTFNDCIDIDSHDVIGWNPVPTRWHPDFMYCAGPWSWRFVPVVKPSLRFFQIAKVVYDNFPNRIWCFSSGNLGLAIWKVYAEPQPTHVVHRRQTNLLSRIGLPHIEHYPAPPKSNGTFGKCHRRPCGMDSGVITSQGVVVDPIEQVRCFMFPPKSPSFEEILDAYFGQLEFMYDTFLKEGESITHSRLTKQQKCELVRDCEEVVQAVWSWARSGYEIDHDLIATNGIQKEQEVVPNVPATPEFGDEVQASKSFPLVENDEYPEAFWRADVESVSRSGQWVQFVKFLVEHGFPCEDRFLEVISTLTKWFVFVEFFGRDTHEVKYLLHTFVAKKHNGKITRWLAGEDEEVLCHVDRIVDNVVISESDQGKAVLSELRSKWLNGKYAERYEFAPAIMGEQPTSSFLSPTIRPSHLLCGGISTPDSGSEWCYEPDLTPLPDDVMTRVRQAFKSAGRSLRQRNGRYPTLDAITRLFNYLFSGRKSGTRRASQKLLVQMGFPKKTKERTAIINALLKARLLHKGDYRAKSQSRRWFLDKGVVEIMYHSRTDSQSCSA